MRTSHADSLLAPTRVDKPDSEGRENTYRPVRDECPGLIRALERMVAEKRVA